MSQPNQNTPQQAPPSGHNAIAALRTATPLQMVNMPAVAEKFKHLFKVFNRQDGATADVVFEQEKFNFVKLVNNNAALAKCEPLSLYGCFMDAAVNGLSFDPTKKHLYLVPYAGKATLMVSPYGELLTRQRAGQIMYADNPVLVYDGDHFRHRIAGGKTEVEYEATLPRKTDNIVGCFICIHRPDGTLDYKVLSTEEVLRFKKFSNSAGSKAWTDGLPGMIQAKTIKHAFRSYPKVPLRGSFSQLVSDKVEDIDHEVLSTSVDYGFDTVTGEVLPDPDPAATYQPMMVVTPADEQQRPAEQQPASETAARQQPAAAPVPDSSALDF